MTIEDGHVTHAPIRQAFREYCGGVWARCQPPPLSFGHDHGRKFMRHDFSERNQRPTSEVVHWESPLDTPIGSAARSPLGTKDVETIASFPVFPSALRSTGRGRVSAHRTRRYWRRADQRIGTALGSGIPLVRELPPTAPPRLTASNRTYRSDSPALENTHNLLFPLDPTYLLTNLLSSVQKNRVR